MIKGEPPPQPEQKAGSPFSRNHKSQNPVPETKMAGDCPKTRPMKFECSTLLSECNEIEVLLSMEEREEFYPNSPDENNPANANRCSSPPKVLNTQSSG